MNLIFITVFIQEKYLDMLYLLLDSIYKTSNLDDIKILIYTCTKFINLIKNSKYFSEKLIFQINNDIGTNINSDNIEKACCARLDFFDFNYDNNIEKILYLDTDIIILKDISEIFKLCNNDVLYAVEEGQIDSDLNYWGKTLFKDEIQKYEDKSAFSSGILLFQNSNNIKKLFNIVKDDMIMRPIREYCVSEPQMTDQPYIVYNAFKLNLYNNKVLKDIAVNINLDMKKLNQEIANNKNKTIFHFPGGPGCFSHKLYKMQIVSNELINSNLKIPNIIPYEFINNILLTKSSMVSKERLVNLYKQCNKFTNTNYSFVECGVAKGGCLALMKYIAGENNKIFGFDIFDGMPDIDKEKDIGSWNKSCPLSGYGKVGDNLSGGIQNVYKTFENLNLSINNTYLIKGFFEDTLKIQNNIDELGDIAILRLDGDWYNSTKICLDKLYDKVVDGGVIIIDNYGHFIGAKNATDEFREKHNIISPLIQTDYTEFYWIKKSSTKKMNDKKYIDIYDDIWTCSDKFREDIKYFFKNKSHYKIAEIGSHKGYTTKYLADIFEKVYAIDNSTEWNNFNKNYNKNKTNIEYINLDIYKNSWNIIPQVDIVFIDAVHSYECCKLDIINSINNFKNLQYIIFDDYGVWKGVQKVVNEYLLNQTLIFEKYIGLNDIPGPNNTTVTNSSEGIICKVNTNN